MAKGWRGRSDEQGKKNLQKHIDDNDSYIIIIISLFDLQRG